MGWVEDQAGGESIDRLWAELQVWAADVRADQAARSRAREAWLRVQSSEAATLTGVLMDLAERAADVAIDLAAQGHTVRGTIRAVGADFAAVTGPSGQLSLVALAAVVAVRSAVLHDLSADRVEPPETCLADVLALLGGDRPDVRLVLASAGQTIAGRLLSVGANLVTVRLPGGGSAVVPTEAIALCQLN